MMIKKAKKGKEIKQSKKEKKVKEKTDLCVCVRVYVRADKYVN